MDISPHSYVSANEILADVLKIVDDSSFKVSSPGWYRSQIRQALEELSFDTFLDERNESFDVPKNLHLDMPKGAFNLRGIYLFRGDNCDIGKSVNVWHKKNFINSNSGNGYVAKDKWENGKDPFYQNRSAGESNTLSNNPSNLFFYSIQNGTIMLSESCRGFPKIMLVFNGIATDISEAPIVPQLYRQAVKDFVSVRALEPKMIDKLGTAEYNHWVMMHSNYKRSLERPYEGSWAKAEHRAKQLNNSVRQNIKEYQSRLNY
jgi:hypothetical protein